MTPRPSSADVLRHMPIVHSVVARFLRRLPRSVDAGDLVSAGMVGLYFALVAYNGAIEFATYARVRIRWAILDELRAQDWLSRRARRRIGEAFAIVDSDALEETVAARGRPDELADQHAARGCVERALGTLPARLRQIVVWHYFDGLSFTAIAARLGVTLPRVSQLHAKAKERLEAQLAWRPPTPAWEDA